MAHYTFIARINAGDGNFPFVNVQFSKNHRRNLTMKATRTTAALTFRTTIPLRSGAPCAPIKIDKDVAVAHTAVIRMEDGHPLK